ncbi:MAG: hypothetical protein LBN94_00940, partial [Puniceicoccales bacterium]|nr:hypothetical protein [Puniceicoccales bacterium]
MEKNIQFYEVEMTVPDGANAPTAKPLTVKNPGNVPSGFVLGITSPVEFTPPNTTKGIVNDLFPVIEEPVIEGAPEPRKSAIDQDFSKTIGALPEYILHPIDTMLRPEDGPGYKEFQFKTQKPLAPTPEQIPWSDPATLGLSPQNAKWLTFLSHDNFFSNTGYKLDSTQLLDSSTSLFERLRNVNLQERNGVWKATTEDYLKEFVFAPDVEKGGLSWAEIVAYVNYYMIHSYLNDNEIINVYDSNVSLGEQNNGGINATTLQYLQDLVASKTSLLLYRDGISVLSSYNTRKVLSMFFSRKVDPNNEDSETIAEALARDLLTVGISTTLEELKKTDYALTTDDSIKEKCLTNVEKYIVGDYATNNPLNFVGEENSISKKAEEILNEFASKNLITITSNSLTEICSDIRKLFGDLVANLIINETRRYKLQCQISQINQYLNVNAQGENLPEIKLSAVADKLSNEQFPILQNALKYVKSQLILLKNENNLPASLTVSNLIVDGKPQAEASDIYTKVTDYLNKPEFNIQEYVIRRMSAPVSKVIHDTLVKEFKASEIRNAIKATLPLGDETQTPIILSERENLRYAMSEAFRNDLERYIVVRILDRSPVSRSGDDTSSLILSLINGSFEDMGGPIKEWINDALERLLQGETEYDYANPSATEKYKNELKIKYKFIENTTMRNQVREIVQRTLKLSENFQEKQSPLVVAVEGQVSEETLVLAYKDKVEAQLQALQDLIRGKVNVGNISASNRETEKFLEYTYAKILKDHYEPIIYNDFVKYTKTLTNWFAKATSKKDKDVITLLTEKIESLRSDYGNYYEALQTFSLHGEAYVFDKNNGISCRYPKLLNQHDLFLPFFQNDQIHLNIAQILTDYAEIYEKYGKKCYSEYTKYSISDYSVELGKLRTKYQSLLEGEDILSGTLLQGIQDELIALKRELEAIDLYTEYIKANNFRKELMEYLLDSLVNDWRYNAVRRQVLVNAIYRIAVDNGVMRMKDDGLYGSGTVDSSIISSNEEKEFNEEAGSYLYAKGIAEYVSRDYDYQKDVGIPVLEILHSIEAYR